MSRALSWLKGMGKLKTMSPRLGMLQCLVRSMPKVAEGFYQSTEWRTLAAQVKRERGCFCQRCGSTDRVIADHVIERKDGGAPLDKSNIELLCHKHHQAKTAKARGERAKGL